MDEVIGLVLVLRISGMRSRKAERWRGTGISLLRLSIGFGARIYMSAIDKRMLLVMELFRGQVLIHSTV